MKTCLVAACLAAFSTLTAADSKPRRPMLRWVDSQAAFFGGREATLTLEVHSGPEAWEGEIYWQITLAHRDLCRRAKPVRTDPSVPARISISVPLPTIEPGAVLEGEIAATLIDSNRSEIARLSRPIHLFHENPFADRTAWLEQLRLILFDPDGRTADCFERVGIPHQRVRSYDPPPEEPGIWIIGEGLPLENYRALGPAMVQVAARGHHVLCLAPAGGEIALPGLGDDMPERPRSLGLEGPDITRRMDRRLDAWPVSEDGRPGFQGLILKAPGRLSVADESETEPGWAWLDMRFPGGGTVRICALPLIARWDDGPTPRLFLLRILESLQPQGEKNR